MPIEFRKSEKQFHLYNKEISYILKIMENGQVENLYYGKRVPSDKSYAYLHQEKNRPLAIMCMDEPSTLSLQYARQEYPSFGGGDFRYTACRVNQQNGSRITEYRYIDHEISKGKKSIHPLPSTYVEDEGEATSLDIRLLDKVTNSILTLSYTIYEELSAICRHTTFELLGDESIVLDNAMSLCLDLPDKDYEMIQLSGAWARERQIKNRTLEEGIQGIYSMRGSSSSEHNPFIALKRSSTTELQGEVYGFSFVYSGNFLAQAEVCSHETTRVLMGIHPDTFSWKLNKGDKFVTPEAVMVYSDKGLTNMSRTYHDLYKTRLVRGKWRDKARPILLNNWEANHMDFNLESILKFASKAKDMGVELFVLDDGWFGARNNDKAGLGDWYCNMEKLPGGIQNLSKQINDMGMEFGLWIEPEMVNPDSDLYRAHPDYILSTPNRYTSLGRTQYVLDFSRQDVRDNIYNQLREVISGSSISYIKWDMNRYITECYSVTHSPEEQGKVMHEYILGVYELYDKLTTEFPDILFESCASGGARFDPGMLYYAPQTWCSDDSDAGERLKIQYGTSMVYPISSIGAHVSACPNFKLKRDISIWGRANVAFYGAFGYELDLNKLSEDDLEKMKNQIIFYKKYRDVIQLGDFYRLQSPFESNNVCWISVSRDKSKAVAGFYQIMNKVNAGYLNIKFTGLNENYSYQVSYEDHSDIYTGSQIMTTGIPIDRKTLNKYDGDFASLLIVFEKNDSL